MGRLAKLYGMHFGIWLVLGALPLALLYSFSYSGVDQAFSDQWNMKISAGEFLTFEDASKLRAGIIKKADEKFTLLAIFLAPAVSMTVAGLAFFWRSAKYSHALFFVFPYWLWAFNFPELSVFYCPAAAWIAGVYLSKNRRA